jgi:hypothetical protein
MVEFLQQSLKLPGSLHNTLQILSVHAFEKIALHEILTNNKFKKPDESNLNQMKLFDL